MALSIRTPCIWAFPSFIVYGFLKTKKEWYLQACLCLLCANIATFSVAYFDMGKSLLTC